MTTEFDVHPFASQMQTFGTVSITVDNPESH